MVRNLKIRQLLLALTACSSVLIFYAVFCMRQNQIWPQPSSIEEIRVNKKENAIDFKATTVNGSTSKNCLILLWRHEKLELEIPRHPLCGGGCELTWDRTRFDEAAAIIIEMKRMFNVTYLPKPEERKPHQIFIWFCRESTWNAANRAKNYQYPFEKYDNYFNWTMSYRVDSDVDGFMMPFTAIPFVNYMLKKRFENESQKVYSDLKYEMINSSAKICEEKTKRQPTLMPDVRKKTKLAVWIAHDCAEIEGAKKRVKIIEELISKGLEVGGNSSCLRKSTSRPIKKHFMPMTEFFETISAHKFYLAFENSYHCKGYITEKFWLNSLYAGAVPVVYGARKEDYNRLAPPRSFIHYDDFATSQDLVDYLQYLDKNNTAYMEYFEWRKLYPCDYPLYRKDDEEYQYSTKTECTFFYNTYCNLCKLLQKGTNRTKTITSLKNYWFDGENNECLNT